MVIKFDDFCFQKIKLLNIETFMWLRLSITNGIIFVSPYHQCDEGGYFHFWKKLYVYVWNPHTFLSFVQFWNYILPFLLAINSGTQHLHRSVGICVSTFDFIYKPSIIWVLFLAYFCKLHNNHTVRGGGVVYSVQSQLQSSLVFVKRAKHVHKFWYFLCGRS